MTVEVLFLGLTVANELGEGGASKRRVVGLTAALVMPLPLGALLGGPVGSLPHFVQGGFLAFGLIALLYLVTEELLVEARETEDRPWVTAMFFAGSHCCCSSTRRFLEQAFPEDRRRPPRRNPAQSSWWW
ncbi:hypothetical protein C7388_105226 [Methylobacterium radiotolerans]|nr:hypothetical protein C7388_105226 [Methylobacterium organophilum]